jgi:hypothetical protein
MWARTYLDCWSCALGRIGKRFGLLLLLLESFGDPHGLHGDVDRAANWPEIEQSQG